MEADNDAMWQETVTAMEAAGLLAPPPGGDDDPPAGGAE
jgi:hypothetical protein